MEHIAIILSGGTGTRFGGDCPKQYLELGDRPVIAWSAAAFAEHPSICGLIVVAAEQWRGYIADKLNSIAKPLAFADPGSTRQLSIVNALEAAERLYGRECSVVVHDAARPLVPTEIITACIGGIEEGYDGVLPVLPVKDTIYRSADGTTIAGLLNRSELFAGQAPESFRLAPYIDAHRAMSPDALLAINGSTEVAHLAGMRMKLVAGSERNFKITTPEDFERFRELAGQ